MHGQEKAFDILELFLELFLTRVHNDAAALAEHQISNFHEPEQAALGNLARENLDDLALTLKDDAVKTLFIHLRIIRFHSGRGLVYGLIGPPVIRARRPAKPGVLYRARMHTECQLEELRLIYQDRQLVAVHKPAALLVHRSAMDRGETRFALQMTRDLIGQHVFPVHRLDKATSGLLVFALDPESARSLAAQFAQRQLRKRYLALVRGWPAAKGVIEKALMYRPDRLGDPDKQHPVDAQTARTRFRCLATTSLDQPLGRYARQRYALLQLEPETGRKHQIRRHLNHLSHPIIGDVNYGDRHHNHLFNRWRGYHRLYLAAVALHFRHPADGRPMALQAPLQNDFALTLTALGLDIPAGLVPTDSR